MWVFYIEILRFIKRNIKDIENIFKIDKKKSFYTYRDNWRV